MENLPPDTNEILKTQNGSSNWKEVVKTKSGIEIELHFIDSPKKPIFAILGKESKGEQMYHGYFAYRLESISQPRTKEEEDKMMAKSLEWHKDIAHLLNSHSPNASFAIRIRNNYEEDNVEKKSKIKIDFVVRVTAKSQGALEKHLDKMNSELEMYLKKTNTSDFHPFVFSPVASKDDLLKNIIPGQQSHAVCSRPTFQTEKKGSVGFKANDDAIKDSAFLLPEKVKVQDLSLSSLMNVLSSINHNVELNLFLHPAKIREEEKLQIKNIISLPVLLEVEFPDERERGEYISYLRTFIRHGVPLFYAGVSFSVNDDGNISNVVKNAICNAFMSDGVEIYFPDVNHNIQHFLPGEISSHEYPKTDFRFLFTNEDFLTSFRFPFPSTDGTPGIKNNPVFSNQLPQNLQNDGVLLGIKKIQNKKIPIYISKNDMRRHIYIMGATGVGKSSMIKTMIMNLIHNGEGCALIEPHSDLILSVLKLIPSWRKKDVVFFDPTDVKNNPIRINILEYDLNYPEQRTFIFNELIKILKDTYRDVPESIGPAFELYFRTFLMLVMTTIRGTLNDVMRAIKDKEYRDHLMELCLDKDISLTINNFMDNTHEQSFQNWVPYLTNKFQRFVKDDFLGPIISEPVSNINFRSVIDDKKILLVKLTKSRLGDDGVKFIGTIILNRLIYAAYSRENISENDRVDFTLFVDEFQNFASSDINNALSEARKYRLLLCLSNQSTSQLNINIMDSILGNVGNFISFRPGIPDVEKIGAYFYPYFTAKELLDMPNFQCVARLLINNAPAKPFIFQTTI